MIASTIKCGNDDFCLFYPISFSILLWIEDPSMKKYCFLLMSSCSPTFDHNHLFSFVFRLDHIHRHTHTHRHTYTYLHTDTHTHRHTYTYLHTDTHTKKHTHTHSQTYSLFHSLVLSLSYPCSQRAISIIKEKENNLPKNIH